MSDAQSFQAELFQPGEFNKGQPNGLAMALAFYIRGQDRADDGEVDLAIADYDAALGINPNQAGAPAATSSLRSSRERGVPMLPS